MIHGRNGDAVVTARSIALLIRASLAELPSISTDAPSCPGFLSRFADIDDSIPNPALFAAGVTSIDSEPVSAPVLHSEPAIFRVHCDGYEVTPDVVLAALRLATPQGMDLVGVVFSIIGIEHFVMLWWLSETHKLLDCDGVLRVIDMEGWNSLLFATPVLAACVARGTVGRRGVPVSAFGLPTVPLAQINQVTAAPL